jgi:hypothetical protein
MLSHRAGAPQFWVNVSHSNLTEYMATKIYRTTDPIWRIVIVIEAIRSLSPPTATFPNGKAVPIKDVVRIAMLNGHKRTTVRYWIHAHDGVAWRVTGNDVALLPVALASATVDDGFRSITRALESQSRGSETP